MREGVDRITHPIPPLVMVPSTSGTGADVSQFCVLSAGMQIEVCRSELTDSRLRDRLGTAKDLTRRAVEQL